MTRKKLLKPKEIKAIEKFNAEMSDSIEDIDKPTENGNTNSHIDTEPIIPKDPNDLKLEIGTETGILDDEYFMDDYDDMYVDSGDLIPKEIIEEAERQFANEKQDELE